MKKLLFTLTAVAGFGLFGTTAAQAQYFSRQTPRDYGDREVVVERGRDREVVVERGEKRNLNDGYDRVYNSRRREKTVYVIQNGRPVRRVVYVDGRGRYYRGLRGDEVYRERIFETYPSQYYDRGGRPRAGVSINF